MRLELVGRTPWSAADALVGLLAVPESRPGGRLRTRGSAPQSCNRKSKGGAGCEDLKGCST
jgi:hypothetical protein